MHMFVDIAKSANYQLCHMVELEFKVVGTSHLKEIKL